MSNDYVNYGEKARKEAIESSKEYFGGVVDEEYIADCMAEKINDLMRELNRNVSKPCFDQIKAVYFPG